MGAPGPVRSLRAAAASELSIQAPEAALRLPERRWIRDQPAIRENRQVSDADLHADRGLRPAGLRDRPVDPAGERHKPAIPSPSGCRRHDPCGPLPEASGQLPGGLVRADAADPRQGYMVAVGLDTDSAGREPTGLRPSAFPLAFGESHPGTGAAPLLGVLPVLECSGEPVEAPSCRPTGSRLRGSRACAAGGELDPGRIGTPGPPGLSSIRHGRSRPNTCSKQRRLSTASVAPP